MADTYRDVLQAIRVFSGELGLNIETDAFDNAAKRLAHALVEAMRDEVDELRHEITGSHARSYDD